MHSFVFDAIIKTCNHFITIYFSRKYINPIHYSYSNKMR